ncbi:MAG: hypothetical protein ACJ8AD_08790 [Gemmatimonadaceae bacterium]
MSFLVSLLLPVLATAVYFHAYPDRAARGLVPAELTTAAALAKGALAGASALIFLAILGVVILAVRGRVVTPPGLDASPVAFWTIQFALAAAIGAAVGVVTTLVLLSSVRSRLARSISRPPIT